MSFPTASAGNLHDNRASGTKQQKYSASSPLGYKNKTHSGSLQDKMWGIQSPQSEDHNRSFDFRSPQPLGSTIANEPRKSRSHSRDRSLTARKSSRSALKVVDQNQSTESQMPLSMKQKFLKDDLQSTISDQISYFSQKMQNILVQKASYEVPIQVHKQRNKIKAETEDTVNLRLASLISSLNTYFNLKLKFCLGKAGIDSHKLDLRPFLDSQEVRQLEVAPMLREHDLEAEEFEKFEAMKNQLGEIEAEAFSRRIPTLEQSLSQASKEDRVDGFKSFGNRWQIKNELIEHMNSEFKSTSDYLTKYSNDKIGNLIREENHVLSRKIFTELSQVVEKLEDQIRDRFEESIAKRVNQLAEILTAHPQRQSSPFKRKPSTSLERRSLLEPMDCHHRDKN